MKHWRKIFDGLVTAASLAWLIDAIYTPNNQDKEIALLYAIVTVLWKIAWTEKT